MRDAAPAELGIDGGAAGDVVIGNVKYSGGVVHVNAGLRLTGVSEDVWGYRIGGYQVLAKWFKSHKGEVLTHEAFEHIRRIAGALGETLAVQERLRGLHGGG
jgi:hypothetical protein